VALPAKYISRALETELERDGDAALTAAEWHLLMVGRFLLAVECSVFASVCLRARGVVEASLMMTRALRFGLKSLQRPSIRNNVLRLHT
jgi:hypothetical protein